MGGLIIWVGERRYRIPRVNHLARSSDSLERFPGTVAVPGSAGERLSDTSATDQSLLQPRSARTSITPTVWSWCACLPMLASRTRDPERGERDPSLLAVTQLTDTHKECFLFI